MREHETRSRSRHEEKNIYILTRSKSGARQKIRGCVHRREPLKEFELFQGVCQNTPSDAMPEARLQSRSKAGSSPNLMLRETIRTIAKNRAGLHGRERKRNQKLHQRKGDPAMFLQCV